MSLQSSTFNSTHVMDNEIIKASDFEFAFEQIVVNVSRATQMFLEATQDFVINGKVLPDSGMNLKVSPIFGVCKSTGIPFGRTETTNETIAFEGSQNGRIDIIEVRGVWETYDEQQRAFNDPDTDTQTYQYVDTKKLMKPEYRVIQGTEGSGVAPDTETGWVKLAEVSIRAGSTSILATDIHNITSDVAGMDNDDWTNEEDATYNIGYISDVNRRFRVQHNEDGTHAEDSIDATSLDIGVGTGQINGNILPVGGSVSIPTQTIAATDSILSVLTKAALMITSLYDSYLKYGEYGFKGELQISSILDANDDLSKPISISADGNGNAVIKVNNSAVLSIDANGKLSTNGYQASSNNHIVTKAVTDGLKTLIDNLDTRVTQIEQTSDVSEYANGVLCINADGGQFDSRYEINYQLQIAAYTYANVTLNGTQSSGITPSSITDGDIILVMNQTDKRENGLYQYSSLSAWARVNDYQTPNQMKNEIFDVGIYGMYYLPKKNYTHGNEIGQDELVFATFLGTIKPTNNGKSTIAVRDRTGHVKSKTSVQSDDCITKGELQDIFDIMHPIGEVYIQYPMQASPQDLYNGNGISSTWQDITDQYGGAFFRAYKSGVSTSFADTTVQPSDLTNCLQASANLSHNHSKYTCGDYAILGGAANPTTGYSSFTTSTNGCHRHKLTLKNDDFGNSGYSAYGPSGTDAYTCYDGAHCHTIYQSKHSHEIRSDGTTESRPINYAIKIWKRVTPSS